MPKASKVAKVNMSLSEFVAFYDDGTIAPIDETSEILNEFMDANNYVQNCYIDAFIGEERVSRKIGTRSTSEQREYFTDVTALPESWTSCHIYNRNNIDESCRIIKIWRTRNYIYELVTKNPDMTNAEVVEKAQQPVNFRLISNIRRSKHAPNKPVIKNARLSLGVDPNIRTYLCRGGVFIRHAHITDRTINFFLPIPLKEYSNLGRIVHIGAPTIQLDKDNCYVFNFLVKVKCKSPKNQPNHLGVDPKLNNGFAAAVIGENKQVSGYVGPSVQTQRCQRKADHISNDIGLKKKKINNIKACEAPNKEKIDELEYQIFLDQEKRQRVNEALDWQAACDIVDYAEQVNADICYENVKCNLGGKLHFRSTQKRAKVKQVAAKHGRKFNDVDAAYTSQDCPRCGTRDKKALSNRTHHCKKCGLKCDRDYASAVNMAKRGGKVKDPRWTEAINAKKQIVRENTLGSRVGKLAKRHTNSGSHDFDNAGQRILLHWEDSAGRKSSTIIVSEYYLVGNVNYKTLPIKQKSSAAHDSGG